MGSALVQEDERIETLRAMIDTMLSETQMYGKIRSAISATGDSKSTLAKLLSRTSSSGAESLSNEEDVLALRVEVLGGSCFVGEAVDAASKGNAHSLRAHFCFSRQRAESTAADACVEPSLRGSFMFRIAKPRPRTESEWHELLTRNGVPRLRVCVTRERSSSQVAAAGSRQRELIATGCIDWRQALLSEGTETAVELKACGPDSVLSEQSNAVLRLSLEIVALGGHRAGNPDEPVLETPFDEETTRREMRRSASRRAETARTFYLYAKDWWNRFTATSSPSSTSGGVRIFSRDETGDLRCVCSTVSPLRAPRGIDSPRHCARFVSLLPLEKSHSSSMGGGGGTDDAWHTPHAFLSRRAGDVWDHATLLCSLLLGFGLEAYVALGEIKTNADKTQPHAWVVTVSSEDKTITAWESATGRRSSLVPLDADANSKYATIACVFDHEKLFANTQKTDLLVQGISLNFEDSTKWMMLDAKGHGGGSDSLLDREDGDDDNKAAFVSPAADFALLGNTRDIPATESALENELMGLIQDRRLSQYGLLTVWDDQLSYMLQPALAAYEVERLTDNAFGNDDFQDAIKRHVPQGHCFKGFPTCFSHLQPSRMLAALERGDLSSDVLSTAGDYVRHALRIKIFPYAEDVCACWLMIATFYKGEGPQQQKQQQQKRPGR